MQIVTATDGKEIDIDSCSKQQVWDGDNLVQVIYSTPFGNYYKEYGYNEDGKCTTISELAPYLP